MKSKLWYLTWMSIKRKLCTKWFVAANILLLIAIVGISNIDTIVKTFGGDFDDKPIIYVIDNTNESYDIFSEQIKLTNSILSDNTEEAYEVKKTDKTLVELEKEIEESSEEEYVVIFDTDETNTLKAKIISEEYLSLTDTQTLTSAINSTKVALATIKSDVSIEQLAFIQAPIEVEREYFDKDLNEEQEEVENLMSMLTPILILPIFMLSIFLVQMIGAEVNDEKTTRGMEIIISNVSAKTHFFSKVLAGNLFVLAQSLLLFLYGVIGLGTRLLTTGDNNIVPGEVTDILSEILKMFGDINLIVVIPTTLILIILTFIAYSLLAGILASMTTNIEDFQQLQTPIMIISLVGFYLTMLSSAFTGSLFIQVCSYIPFISAILSPSLLLSGELALTDMFISIIIMIITNALLIIYGLKIYKVGILNYSSKDLWKKMFKAMKNK